MSSKAKAFSHIYVETAALDHPRTAAVLSRFPRSRVVEVDDYQNVFGRGRQDFRAQKASPKLVLAVKKDTFLYPGNNYVQVGLSPNFVYNTPVLNCPYDCHYCYLQGMYASANIVAFVNQEAFMEAAGERLRARPDPGSVMPLAISYDSDLLALEPVLGFVREWVEWSRAEPDLLLEVRTKSGGKRFCREVAPSPSVRLDWTLSPEAVCRRYETGAAPLARRLEALCEAADRGWRTGICLDPVLKVPGGDRIYGEFADLLVANLPWERIERVEIGVFRVNPGFFKRMRKRPGTDLLHYPYEHANNAISYPESDRTHLMEILARRFRDILPPSRLFLWT